MPPLVVEGRLVIEVAENGAVDDTDEQAACGRRVAVADVGYTHQFEFAFEDGIAGVVAAGSKVELHAEGGAEAAFELVFGVADRGGEAEGQGEIVDKVGFGGEVVGALPYPNMPLQPCNLGEVITSFVVERGGPGLAAKFKIKRVSGLESVVISLLSGGK